MATLQSRLQRLSQKHSAPGPSMQSRLDRLRKRHGKQEEEDEEKGFLSRLYYGEEEGEGGAMGLEEIPGQFWDVVKSPIEMGVKPLVSLGSGIAKIAVDSDEDEDTRLARMAGTQLVESISDLPEAIRRGHPTEGLMNLATVVSLPFTGGGSLAGMVGKVPKLGALAKVGEGLSRVARTKGIRVAEAVADPMSALIGKGAGAAWRRRPKGAPKGEGAPKGAKERIKKVKEALEGEETTPMRSQLAESVVKFFTNLPEQTATKMFDYAADAILRNKMLKGRKDPTGAYARAQQVLKEHARKAQEEASASFGRAQASLDEVKIEGRPPPGDALVDIDIRSERGRAFVDEVENMLSQPTSTKPQGFGANLEVVIEYRGGRFGKKIRQEIIPYAEIMDGSKVIPEGVTYNIRVKHGRRATIPVKDRALIDGEITKMLNATDAAGEYKGITAGNMLNDMEKFQTDLARLAVEDRPSSALTSRLRAAQKDAVKGPIEEAGGNLQYMEDYHLKQLELDQLAEDFGVKKGSPRTVQDVVNNKIGAAYEEATKLNKLEDIVGAELVAEIVGAQSKRWFGTGLHVKAELSGMMRGLGRPAAAVATLGVAGVAGVGLWAMAPLPLMVFYSPRAASTLLSHLDKVPRIRKAITGRTDIPIPKTKATELVGLVRRLLGKLDKRGLGMKDLASAGMTFGQLMERLQIEEEQQ